MTNVRLAAGLACSLLFVAPGFTRQPSKRENLGTLLEKFRSDDDRVRYQALTSISNSGRDVIPKLVEALNRENGYARVYVVRAIRAIEPTNQLGQQSLIVISRDKNEKLEVRRYSSYVLALSSTGVPELAKMLDDRDVFVRRSAVFALQELFAISASLASDYRPVLTDALAQVIAGMGDEDSLVRGVAVEIVEQVQGDIDFALDYCIEKSPNGLLRENARQVEDKRRRGIKELGQQLTMDMKPGAEENMKKNKKLVFGTLGVIYALRIGGEPVEDFRTLPDAEGWCLRITLNPITHHAGSGQSRFNPYLDLK